MSNDASRWGQGIEMKSTIEPPVFNPIRSWKEPEEPTTDGGQMNLIVPYTWSQASSPKFSSDAIRKKACRFRRTRKMGIIENFTETNTGDIRGWLAEQKTKYALFGLFADEQHQLWYRGLVFKFDLEDDLMMFKLTFL